MNETFSYSWESTKLKKKHLFILFFNEDHMLTQVTYTNVTMYVGLADLHTRGRRPGGTRGWDHRSR